MDLLSKIRSYYKEPTRKGEILPDLHHLAASICGMKGAESKRNMEIGSLILQIPLYNYRLQDSALVALMDMFGHPEDSVSGLYPPTVRPEPQDTSGISLPDCDFRSRRYDAFLHLYDQHYDQLMTSDDIEAGKARDSSNEKKMICHREIFLEGDSTELKYIAVVAKDLIMLDLSKSSNRSIFNSTHGMAYHQHISSELGRKYGDHPNSPEAIEFLMEKFSSPDRDYCRLLSDEVGIDTETTRILFDLALASYNPPQPVLTRSEVERLNDFTKKNLNLDLTGLHYSSIRPR